MVILGRDKNAFTIDNAIVWFQRNVCQLVVLSPLHVCA